MNTIIKRRVLVSMIFIGLVMMGIFSQKYLPMELYPNADLPVLSVNITSKSELDPTYVENQAVIPVEGAASALAGVEEMETRITPRGANVTISFAQSVDLKYAFLQLEERIKSISGNIPEIFEIQVNKAPTGMANDMFMEIQVLGNEDIDYIRNITDEEVVPYLENIDGIASVNTLGGREKSIEVIVDPEKCEALNITNSRISSLISQNLDQMMQTAPDKIIRLLFWNFRQDRHEFCENPSCFRKFPEEALIRHSVTAQQFARKFSGHIDPDLAPWEPGFRPVCMLFPCVSNQQISGGACGSDSFFLKPSFSRRNPLEYENSGISFPPDEDGVFRIGPSGEKDMQRFVRLRIRNIQKLIGHDDNL